MFYLFTIYSSVEKGAPVSGFRFFSFFPKSPFFICTSQNSALFGWEYLFTPLGNRGSIKIYFRVLSYFSFYHFQKYHPNIIISIFEKNYSLHYGQHNVQVHTWKIQQKTTWHDYQRKTEDMSWHG